MKKKLSTCILLSLTMVIMLGASCTKAIDTNATISPDLPHIAETTTEIVTEPPTETEPHFEPVNVDLVMVGDILAHEGVYKSGYFPDGTVNFDHIFANVKDDLQAADIAIVNQEVVLGGTELGLSAYPCFNSPTELGDALITAGFNVILHATNHALDKGIKGIDNTLNFWKTSHPEIPVLGIHDENFTDYNTQDIYVYEKNGLRISILNYTYGTNGIPIPKSRPLIVNMLEEDKVRADVARAKEISDFVIVCPHWGTEYVYTPDSYQQKWTGIFYELGVDLVIGTHPHVIEPVEWIEKEGNDHKMLVYYSLGNFVSYQNKLPRMLGGMAQVTISMDSVENLGDNLPYGKRITIQKDGREEECLVYISNYGVEPVVTHKLYGPGLITTYKLSDYTDELAAQNLINNDESGFSVKFLKDLSKQVFGDLVNFE